jgi:hypothetical protein
MSGCGEEEPTNYQAVASEIRAEQNNVVECFDCDNFSGG